jgi:fermentation-respiration switch protein FrsA (DUF1100 family)
MRSVEHRFIFFPTRELIGSPRDAGLDYSDVYLTTEDGVRLHGWWVPAQPERAVLVFFHGNGGNISDRVESIRQFHDLDLSVFIVDYRGYGRSEGTPSEAGTYLDAEAAWAYVRSELGVAADRIVLFGRSLGAAVAIELATRHTPKAIIVESAFSSIPAMAAATMPLPVGPFLRTRYDNLAKIGLMPCPVLVVHSRDDEIIPFRQGEALFDAAPEPKAFVELRHGHNEGFILSGERYTGGLQVFLTEHVAPPPARPKDPVAPKSAGDPASDGGGEPDAPPSTAPSPGLPPAAPEEELTD